jgi:hypothetical protein
MTMHVTCFPVRGTSRVHTWIGQTWRKPGTQSHRATGPRGPMPAGLPTRVPSLVVNQIPLVSESSLTLAQIQQLSSPDSKLARVNDKLL